MTTYAGSADLTELVRNLGLASKNAPKEIQDLLVTGGNGIATLMKEKAPKKTGRLADSVRVISFPGKVEIGPTVPYGVYQEFGTGTRGEFPTGPYIIKPIRAERLVFKIDGKIIRTKRVVHPGIRPHPFARPALTEYIDTLGTNAAKVGVSLVQGRTNVS